MAFFVSVILAPAVFWLLYHYHKDRYRPEPLVALGLTYLAGFAAGFACVHAYDWLRRHGIDGDPSDGRLGFLVYCVLVVGLLEEAAKLVPFAVFCMRLRQFDEPIDGIVYASVVALGFASFENVEYMSFLSGGPMLARAIASPLTHCMFASIWGYACGRARADGRSLWLPLSAGLALAAAAHGLYDFVVVATHPILRPATAGLILAIWIWRMRLIRRLHAEDAERHAKPADSQETG